MWADYLDKMDARELTGPFRLGWGMDYPHPQNFLELLLASWQFSDSGGANSSFFDNAEFDAALQAALVEPDLEKAIPLYEEATRVACENIPVIPVYYSQNLYAWNDNADNVFIDAFGDLAYDRVTAGSGIVSTYISEPASLVTLNDNESEGIAVLRALYTNLIEYDPETSEGILAAAESIESADGQTWVIKLKPGMTFHDGTPVTANSFVDAWNYGAWGLHGMKNAGFFADIQGYDELNPES